MPKSLALIVWPTVVAFSLTKKTWGHVIIDGLQRAAASGAAWRELVLPAPTKELLRSTAASVLRGHHTIETDAVASHDVDAAAAALLLNKKPRYESAPDLVEGKGAGALFLCTRIQNKR